MFGDRSLCDKLNPCQKTRCCSGIYDKRTGKRSSTGGKKRKIDRRAKKGISFQNKRWSRKKAPVTMRKTYAFLRQISFIRVYYVQTNRKRNSHSVYGSREENRHDWAVRSKIVGPSSLSSTISRPLGPRTWSLPSHGGSASVHRRDKLIIERNNFACLRSLTQYYLSVRSANR